MSNARAKTINLLLYEGDLSGVISIEDSSWNSGELYSAPRASVTELLETGACNKYGVYLLLSQDMVYIGQSSDLAKRITQHTIGKDWWESAIILTTKDDSLNHSDIDYLESVLIEKALKNNRLDCDNKTKGNPVKVDKFRKVFLGQYLEEALFLMQLIGVNVFSENKVITPKKSNEPSALIHTIDSKTVLTMGKRVKSEAIDFARQQGYTIGKKASYANKQAGREIFWINPPLDVVNQDWDLVLNNNEAMELIILHVPANTLKLRSANEGHLLPRKDQPHRIDIKLNIHTLEDAHGYADFSQFIVGRIKY